MKVTDEGGCIEGCQVMKKEREKEDAYIATH